MHKKRVGKNCYHRVGFGRKNPVIIVEEKLVKLHEKEAPVHCDYPAQ